MAFDLGGLLQHYIGRGADQPAAEAPEHYQQVASEASAQTVSDGLVEAFRSDQTPPFAQMVAQLFDRATPDQRAGMLNQLLGGLGPAALAALMRGGVLRALGVSTPAGAAATPITPQQALAVSPTQVQQIAEHAEQHDPGIVEQMSDFYAKHSELVKTLGAAALTIALAKMAERARH
jgi:hypothetical protein